MSLLERLRGTSDAQKSHVAFWAALIPTLVIALMWGMSLDARLNTEVAPAVVAVAETEEAEGPGVGAQLLGIAGVMKQHATALMFQNPMPVEEVPAVSEEVPAPQEQRSIDELLNEGNVTEVAAQPAEVEAAFEAESQEATPPSRVILIATTSSEQAE